MDKRCVVVIDDDASVLRATGFLLEKAGYLIAPFASAEDFLMTEEPTKADCILLDVRMPGMNGIELQETLIERKEPAPIVFMSGHSDIPLAVRAMKLGATDFLEKPFGEEPLLAAVGRAVQLGEQSREAMIQRDEVEKLIAQLTPREHQVMDLVVAGGSNKTIARDLDISPRTVEVYRARVMDKMGTDSLAELVQLILGARKPDDTGFVAGI